MRERIANHIASNGPMTFDVYMEWCLYDPEGGFFSAGPVRSGKSGDFVTSPEISWAFGYCVGEWAQKNAPGSEALLVEIGSGSGAMLAQVADAWTAGPMYAIELSAAARVDLIDGFDNVNVAASMDEVPTGVPAVVIANEVLDNMPAALARRVGDGWIEIGVRVDGDHLVLADMAARSEVSNWCEEMFGDALEGTVVSVQIAVSEWIQEVLDRFGKVSLCLIDYGGSCRQLLEHDPGSVVRTYRRHQSGTDWLQQPGVTDVTVDVNIDGVVSAIARAGGSSRVLTQRDFCLEYGLTDLIADATDLEQVSAKAGDVMAQLANRSERIDFEALIDPNGLGAFQVVIAE